MNVTPEARHLTASMAVVDPQSGSVLLVFHNAMQRWVFPGGHVDAGSPDRFVNLAERPHEAALREVLEETGVRAQLVTPPPERLLGLIAQPQPLMIAETAAPMKPERPGKPAEPAHTHLDMLYVGTADRYASTRFPADEVSAVRWVGLRNLELLLRVREDVPVLAEEAMQYARRWRTEQES